MTPFKVISVDILSDGGFGFFKVIVLCQICFFVLEAAKPTLNRDVVCPAAFATLNAFLSGNSVQIYLSIPEYITVAIMIR